MDLLLVLVLIGWIVSQMSKKKPKARAAGSGLRGNKEPFQPNKEQVRKQNPLIESNSILQEKGGFALQRAKVSESDSVAELPRREEIFRGSMKLESSEGECLCDPQLEHAREQTSAPESVYTSEIGREPLVDFSSRGLMQAVVMSEILNRPVKRHHPR